MQVRLNEERILTSSEEGILIGIPSDFETFTDKPERDEKIFNVNSRIGNVMLGCDRNRII